MTSELQYTRPARLSMGTTVRRHWRIVAAAAILFVAVALVLGLKRTPEYTATSELSVGHAFVDSPAGIPGVIEATKSLASVYSRTAGGAEVYEGMARRLRSQGIETTGAISASPIPDSPLIRVTGEADSEREAVALANAGSEALAAHVNGQVSAERSNDATVKRYEEASTEWRQALEASARATSNYRDDPSPSSRVVANRAAAKADVAELRREALRLEYQASGQSSANAPTLEAFSPSNAATSDRSSTLQILLFIGLIGGLAAGTALALLRGQQELRPSLD
ncbi:MAG TPA: hypothetical protein VEX36_11285 [Thermoleophilaceae bacterium]|nr:hypothetical protein [Thermoleophilaceae bacterium]